MRASPTTNRRTARAVEPAERSICAARSGTPFAPARTGAVHSRCGTSTRPGSMEIAALERTAAEPGRARTMDPRSRCATGSHPLGLGLVPVVPDPEPLGVLPRAVAVHDVATRA